MRLQLHHGYWPIPLILLTCFSCSVVQAQSAREIAKKVIPSVVLLVMEDANGQPLSMGSGFIVREGVVATNLHVIEGASGGYAKLTEQKTKFNIAGHVGIDTARDLVLLSVKDIQAPALTIGDSKKVAVGDEVYAVGNPHGLEGTFSAGIVSSVREIEDDYLLQITAPISPGSSGGPVVDNTGEVVGVAVATVKGGQSLNFAIPSSYLAALIDDRGERVELPGNDKEEQEAVKSILAGLGNRSTDNVEGTRFIWDGPGQFGGYSFSLKNNLHDPIKDVYCLVIFYDLKDTPIDVDEIRFAGVIPGGLAKRLTGRVTESVEKLNTPISPFDQSMRGQREAKGTVELRILYFELVNEDAPVEDAPFEFAPVEVAPFEVAPF